jgi:asparagine synthetase B (glutamine-hydrolysing)
MRRRLARLDEEAPSERDERFMRALELEARAPGPAREAFVRFREMGLAPDALARHAGARAAVRRRLRRRRPFEAPPEDMSREAFEAALGLHRSQAPRRLAV